MSIFSPKLECRLLDACIVAYDIKNNAIDPTVPFYNNIGIKQGTQPTVFVDGPENINAGFVAETSDNWVFVVFRGTLPPFHGDFWAWVEDWLQDFEASPVDWNINGRNFGKVETGFAKATLNLWPHVKQALSNIDLNKKTGIIVTGHSKGGGMTFPVASLIKSTYPHIMLQNCSFAAPLACDQNFKNNYDNLGLDTFTVRFQNRYDLVPFLPYYPHINMLQTIARLEKKDSNKIMNLLEQTSDNDYVHIGHLRYLAAGCVIEYGTKGQNQADTDIWNALKGLHFQEIIDAHSAAGRYHQCICSQNCSQ